MIAHVPLVRAQFSSSRAVLSQLLAGRRDVDGRVTRDPRSSSSFDDFSPVLRHPSESGRSAPAVSVLRASYSPSLPARAHPRSLTHTRCSLSAQLSASRGSGSRGWRGGQALERRPTTSSSSPARAQRAPASPPASPPPRVAYPSCAVCVADRTPVGPQIVFASPPCLRRYAAGLPPPRPGRQTTWRRLGGDLGWRRRHRRPFARASTMCGVRAGEGAVARSMAVRGRRGRAAWPCEVREGAPGLDAPGRRPQGRVPVCAGVLRALVCLSSVQYCMRAYGPRTLG